MKRNFLILFFLLFFSALLQAQVKIGENPTAINANAVLEIEAPDKGLLMPRVELTSTSVAAPLSAHVAGMTVYNTATTSDVTPGYYYNDGSKWIRIANANDYWSTAGNAGTTPGTNFIGTTDNKDVIFKHNNASAGWLNTGNFNTAFGAHTLNPATNTGSGNVALGYGSLLNNISGFDNTATGVNTLRLNTAGRQNVAIGYSALQSNTTGNANVAVGTTALENNTSGNLNCAVGEIALQKNTYGIENSVIGYSSMRENISGNYNTANGSRAAQHNTTGNYNTAIGYSALNANITGNENIAIGCNAGQYVTGSKNIAIGVHADVPSPSDNNQLSIGNAIYGLNINDSNPGNDLIGIGFSAPTNRLHIAGSNNPLRLEGLQPGAATDKMLTADANGVVRVLPIPSSSSGASNNFTFTTSTLVGSSHILMNNTGNYLYINYRVNYQNGDGTSYSEMIIPLPAFPGIVLYLPAGTLATGDGHLDLQLIAAHDPYGLDTEPVEYYAYKTFFEETIAQYQNISMKVTLHFKGTHHTINLFWTAT